MERSSHPRRPRRFLAAAAVAAVCLPTIVVAKQAPEDLLKGRVILSDKPIPTSWSSVGSYVAQLKAMNKSTLWYDKKTGKAKVSYAAFFPQPINDVQVMLVLYDITGGAHQQKMSSENFMNRGDRALFNTVTLDKEDLDGNKKYLFAIEYRHRIIASTQFTLRMEGPHYSGQVSFTDEETKK